MITLLIDANIEGHVAILDARLSQEPWRDFRDSFGMEFLELGDVGLDRTAEDDVVWRLCQEHGYYLLTANRNMRGDDSLEATIRREGTLDSLPVFTFSNVNRLYEGADYVDKVADRLLTYLLEEGDIRGTARLYLP